MAVPFGFSVGDFVAAIGLINDVHKALGETGGARDSFKDIYGDLTQLELVLAQLQDGGWAKGCDLGHANAVRGMALTCQVPLKAFLEKLNLYKPMLVKQDAGGFVAFIKGKGRQVGWVLQMQDEVKEFRAAIMGKVAVITLLMSIPTTQEQSSCFSKIESVSNTAQEILTASIEASREMEIAHAKQVEDFRSGQRASTFQISRLVGICSGIKTGVLDIRHSIVQHDHVKAPLDRIENCQRHIIRKILTVFEELVLYINKVRFVAEQLVRMLGDFSKETIALLKKIFETNLEMYALLRRIASQIPTGLLESARDCIHFQDALGRSRDLPYRFFCHWKVFEAILHCDFKGLPGADRVRRGEFHILDTKFRGQVISRDEWSRVVFPDANLQMSITIAEKTFLQGSCPRPGCEAHNTPQDQTSSAPIICADCGLEYYPTSVVRTDVPDLFVWFRNDFKEDHGSSSFLESQDLHDGTFSTGTYQSLEGNRKRTATVAELEDLRVFKRVHISEEDDGLNDISSPSSHPNEGLDPEADDSSKMYSAVNKFGQTVSQSDWESLKSCALEEVSHRMLTIQNQLGERKAALCLGRLQVFFDRIVAFTGEMETSLKLSSIGGYGISSDEEDGGASSWPFGKPFKLD
ncbi:uncharacterized protein PAC_07589 [Phialocephala subalpina]|uniref:Ubiquitin-like domain-containing protein n=1 Tax=Phialocephala subalpina TaxID=576137 RepID=A0A1L7WY47_9HELO|nr:uncharacterized protein PAC_07589 [Phialocephala subalpina]